MTGLVRLGMIVLVLLTAGLLVACEEDDDGGDSPTATAEATGSDGETPDDGETPTEESDGGSGSFEDIPIPDGATESGSGSFTADQIPFVDPGGSIDASAYGNIEWRTFDVEGDAESTLDFYESALEDWDEVFKVDSGAGAFGIWSRNDGDEVLWVGFTDLGEGTDLIVIHGTAS